MKDIETKLAQIEQNHKSQGATDLRDKLIKSGVPSDLQGAFKEATFRKQYLSIILEIERTRLMGENHR